MASVAVIPARGGSKRLPRKNLRLLAGDPLIIHTLRVAVRSGVFDEVVVTSDSDEILQVCDTWVESTTTDIKVTLEMRKPELAADTATALEVVCELLPRLQHHQVITLMLPTAPMRRESHLARAFASLSENIALDGVISVTDYDFPIQLGFNVNESLIDLRGDEHPLITGNTRSQDFEKTYRPNGAFYIKRMDAILRDLNFWRGRIEAFYMSRDDSIDVDTESDLELANFVLSKGSARA